MRGSPRLSSGAFPGSLASHAAGRVRQRPKAFVPDRLTTILANAVRPLRSSVARVFGLLALLLEDLLDGLCIGTLTLHLREVGSAEAPAHIK
jgi:hypothetical protein